MYESLYEENKKLVEALARQYAPACALDRAISEEDLRQAGFLALVRAAATYDPEGGKTWATWAAWNIRCEFHNLLGIRSDRFTRADTEVDSLDRPVAGEDGDGCALSELIADERIPAPDEALLREETRRGVRDAVDRLKNPDQRRAVTLRHLEGLSFQEAARRMGTTPSHARRLCFQGGTRLAKDPKLLAQLDLDERTRFHAHKGVRAFNCDWTSVTEAAAIWRIEHGSVT